MLNINNWFILALISAFFLGINVILIKSITTRGLSPTLTTAYVFTFASIVLWSVAIFTEGISFPKNSTILILLLCACITSALGSLTSFTAFRYASNPGYARAVSSVNIIIAFIISIFIFNSRFDMLGFLGILLIVAGAIILSKVI